MVVAFESCPVKRIVLANLMGNFRFNERIRYILEPIRPHNLDRFGLNFFTRSRSIKILVEPLELDENAHGLEETLVCCPVDT